MKRSHVILTALQCLQKCCLGPNSTIFAHVTLKVIALTSIELYLDNLYQCIYFWADAHRLCLDQNRLYLSAFLSWLKFSRKHSQELPQNTASNLEKPKLLSERLSFQKTPPGFKLPGAAIDQAQGRDGTSGGKCAQH